MNAQIPNPSLAGKEYSRPSRMQRFIIFAVFLICGLAILFFGSNYFSIFPTNRNLAYNLVVSAVFMGLAIWFRLDKRWNRYWQVAFAFFTASLALPVTLLLSPASQTVLAWFNQTDVSSQGQAIAKVYEVVLVAVPILVLTKLSGADLGFIYLKRGNLKWGLSIGGLIWFNFAASALLFFATRFTNIDRLAAAVVWGLVFSFSNSFMEELWLRGIFLRRFQPLLGIGGSVLLTSILFAMIHAGATYLTPVAIPFMLANTFTMGLACGYLMMKTDSIWGAVLIHAASDLFLFIAILANA